MSNGFPRDERRPGPVARAAAGAWHVPAGLAFLAANRNLWPLAILPVLLAAVLVGLGAVGGLFLAPIIESRFAPSPTRLPAGLGLALTLSLWAGIVFAAMTVGLALTLLLSAPMLERLSRKVEAQMGGRGAGRVPSERWEIGPALRAGAIFLTASLLALALALVPLVGPLLSLALAAPLLCYQAMDPTLRRRGFGMEQERHWLWRWRGEAAGFGLAALLTLLLPVISALLPPALAIGAARLVLDLEGVEAEQTASTPDASPAS